jgi:hypothetical protein
MFHSPIGTTVIPQKRTRIKRTVRVNTVGYYMVILVYLQVGFSPGLCSLPLSYFPQTMRQVIQTSDKVPAAAALKAVS